MRCQDPFSPLFSDAAMSVAVAACVCAVRSGGASCVFTEHSAVRRGCGDVLVTGQGKDYAVATH